MASTAYAIPICNAIAGTRLVTAGQYKDQYVNSDS
jgi:hypothetical protein